MGLLDKINKFFKTTEPENSSMMINVFPGVRVETIKAEGDAIVTGKKRYTVVTVSGRKPAFNYLNGININGLKEGSVKDYVPRIKEIQAFLRYDSYVSISVSRYTNAILRRGWTLIGDKKEDVSKISNRIEEISQSSFNSFDETLRQFTRSLVAYGNGFIAFRRMPKSSAKAKIYTIGGVPLSPIEAIQSLSPISLSFKLKEDGTPKLWVVNEDISGNGETINILDLFYCTADNDAGELFGHPYIANVIEDIKYLRAAEQWSLSQAFAYGSPLLQIKVGTDAKPCSYEADDYGYTEIEKVRLAVEAMGETSTFITDHRVETKFITPDSGVNVNETVKRFEDKVISGLGLSPVMLGRSASSSKSSAEVQDSQFVNNASDYQAIIEKCITNNLIYQLCIEQGIDLSKSRVIFKFHPIDDVSARANEIHAANLFNRNVITIDEARSSSGFGPLSKKDEKRLYTTMFNINVGDTNSDGEIKNLEQPQNQHGKQQAKPKYKKDYPELPKVIEGIEDLSNCIIENILDDISNSIQDGNLTKASLDNIIDLSIEDIEKNGSKISYYYMNSICPEENDILDNLNKEPEEFFKKVGEKAGKVAKNTLLYIANKYTNIENIQDLNIKTSTIKQLKTDLNSIKTILFSAMLELIKKEIDSKIVELGIIDIDDLN